MCVEQSSTSFWGKGDSAWSISESELPGSLRDRTAPTVQNKSKEFGNQCACSRQLGCSHYFFFFLRVSRESSGGDTQTTIFLIQHLIN